jgi:L-amino acid N-acyltransferase YncA
MTIVTQAARTAWINTESPDSYPVWIAKQKANGFYWSASDE